MGLFSQEAHSQKYKLMNTNSQQSISKLRIKAPAKINLHLQILGVRKDKFHELAMVMQSISLYDSLDFRLRNDNRIILTSTDNQLPTDTDNLIVKAAKLLQEKYVINTLGVEIRLTKNIPIGAGLAGGSSDAAATLIGLNILWNLNLSTKDLELIASQIGSDVPFCVSGGTQLCFGRGEVLEPLNSRPTPLSILLLKDPLVSVSTPWAYSKSREHNHKNYLTNVEDFEYQRQSLRRASWLTQLSSDSPPPLRNDLQDVVTKYVPEVCKALSLLSSFPYTLSSAMSGSGASCFAIYPDIDHCKETLGQNHSLIESNGFEAWCCSFQDSGPEIIYE